MNKQRCPWCGAEMEELFAEPFCPKWDCANCGANGPSSEECQEQRHIKAVALAAFNAGGWGGIFDTWWAAEAHDVEVGEC